MIPDNTPQAVQSCHQLMLWVIPQLDKFPRNRRFTLGEKIEQGLLSVLSLLVEASYTGRAKTKLLQQSNTQLTVLRHLWRLSFELKVIAQKQYAYGSKMLIELGKQIGGCQKSSASKV
jgi:DNA polymerase III alpha subunit